MRHPKWRREPQKTGGQAAVITNYRLSVPLKEALKQYAAEQNQSQTTIITTLLLQNPRIECLYDVALSRMVSTSTS